MLEDEKYVQKMLALSHHGCDNVSQGPLQEAIAYKQLFYLEEEELTSEAP